jgi:diguanylate cyclase (GGDEF)-like protein/PAS domain S-box-containing protein
VPGDSPFTFRPQRAAGKLYLIILLFLVIGLLQFFAGRFQADVLSAVRAYVAGEGLWSKAQKDGMQNLLRYAATRDEQYYRAFEKEMTVPLGDMRARLELQKPQPDLAVAYRGLIAGGNHPDDVPGLVWLFRTFHRVPHLAEAIRIWTEADAEIARLRELAGLLRANILAGNHDRAIAQVLMELEQGNRRLTRLEERFSSTLGEAARRVTQASIGVNLLFTVLLLAGGALLAWRLVRNVRRAEDDLACSEAQFRRLAASNIIGVAFWKLDGTLLDANDALLQTIGVGREQMTDHKLNWRSLTPPEHLQAVDKALAEMAERGVCTPFETEWRHRDGSRIPILAGAALLEGQPEEGVAFVQDLSERRRAEEGLRLAEKVIEQSSEAIVITDERNRVIRVNRAFTEITGYGAEEVLGKDPGILKSGRHAPEFYREMWHRLDTAGYWRGEIWDRRKSGEVYPKWLNISAIKNTKGEVSHYSAIFSDITAQKAYQDRLEQFAHYDALTGLPNRVLLADRLQQAMAQARRYGQRLAVIYLDLDGFKAINDTHGHDVGDRFLVALATRMKRLVRESDTLARLGGDEFVGVMGHLADERAYVQRFTELLDIAADPVHLEGSVLRASASLGVTFYPQAREVDAAELLHQADQAMYRAKLAGKSRYQIFEPERDGDVEGV